MMIWIWLSVTLSIVTPGWTDADHRTVTSQRKLRDHACLLRRLSHRRR